MGDSKYPDNICQDCGKACKITEEVKNEIGLWELWCYCEECDLETLHEIPRDCQ